MKVDQKLLDLIRSGLVPNDEVSITRAALSNPEEKVKSYTHRKQILKVLNRLLKVVTKDSQVFHKVKLAVRKLEEREDIVKSLKAKLKEEIGVVKRTTPKPAAQKSTAEKQLKNKRENELRQKQEKRETHFDRISEQ